jgi:protein phosphatase
LGRQDIQEIEVQRLDVQPGDRLLLCSDGLTEELSDKKIESILKSIRAGDQTVKNLVSAAKDKGGRDNITAIAITLENVT